jgi:hypothetical protein
MSRNRGVALITALMISSFLFVMVIALITVTQQDLWFATAQERQAKAYFAATAGLDFYRAESERFSVASPITHKIHDDPQYDISFTVQLLATGDVVSSSTVKTQNGNIVAQRTLMARGGDFTDIIDESL